MSDKDKIQRLTAMMSAAKADFDRFKPDFADLSRHFLPTRSLFVDDGEEASKRMLRDDIVDDTPKKAIRTLSAGMHGGMTSPARPWFALSLPDPDLTQHSSVKMWLDDTTRRMRELFSRSNFYHGIQNLYDELAVFGTNFMFEHQDDRSGLRFDALTIGEYYLACDSVGRVNTIFRISNLTAAQIVEQYGYKNCPEKVRDAYDKASTQSKQFRVIHAITPNQERDPLSLNARNKPFGSYHWIPGEENFLRVSGYNMLPGAAPRWSTVGNGVWGVSPGMENLASSRMLEAMMHSYLHGENLRLDPPLMVDINVKHLDMLPGGITRAQLSGSANPDRQVYPLYQVQPDTMGTFQNIQIARQQIREGLYNDLFRMLSGFTPTKQMTATEVAERHEEKLLQLGPILERLHAELFIPLIDRTFSIMVEGGQIMPPPEEIQGMEIKVDFVSVLAQAQKMVQTGSVNQFMGFIGSYAPLNPDMADVVDTDAIAEGYADYLGVDARFIRPKEDREAIRQQRAQAAQQAQAMEAMKQGAGAAKDMGAAKMGEGSALDALLSGVMNE